MPWKIFVTLLLAVMGLAALSVAIAAEILPDAPHGNAWPLFMTGAALLALAWRGYNRPRR